MNANDQEPRSPSSRVGIDGGRVKFLRESKGLTQLYISTFLGVTTDTVSRWENRKYPTVKWENVEKLAEALGVEVDEILDSRPGVPDGPDTPPADSIRARPRIMRKRLLFMGFSLLIFLLFVTLVLISVREKEIPSIRATRYLPKRVPAGQTFPVVVRVDADDNIPFSFILEETLSDNGVVQRGNPPIASASVDKRTVKWISNSGQSPVFIAYLVRISGDEISTGKVGFDGQIKADSAPGYEQQVTGDTEIELSDFHWADTNMDRRIDDEEILALYSSAEVLKNLGADIDLIMKIWSSGGYEWDQENKEYKVKP